MLVYPPIFLDSRFVVRQFPAPLFQNFSSLGRRTGDIHYGYFCERESGGFAAKACELVNSFTSTTAVVSTIPCSPLFPSLIDRIQRPGNDDLADTFKSGVDVVLRTALKQP